MKRLQIQCEEESQSLCQVAEEAGRKTTSHCTLQVNSNRFCALAECWMERASDSLRVISETRLRR